MAWAWAGSELAAELDPLPGVWGALGLQNGHGPLPGTSQAPPWTAKGEETRTLKLQSLAPDFSLVSRPSKG